MAFQLYKRKKCDESKEKVAMGALSFNVLELQRKPEQAFLSET